MNCISKSLVSISLFSGAVFANDQFQVSDVHYQPISEIAGQVKIDFCSVSHAEDCFFISLNNDALKQVFTGALIKNQQGNNDGFLVSAKLGDKSYSINPDQMTGSALRLNNSTTYSDSNSLEFDFVAILGASSDVANDAAGQIKLDKTTFLIDGYRFEKFLRLSNRANNFGFEKSDCDYALDVFMEAYPLVGLLIAKMDDFDSKVNYYHWREKHFTPKYSLISEKYSSDNYPIKKLYFTMFQKSRAAFINESFILSNDIYDVIDKPSEQNKQRIQKRLSAIKNFALEFQENCPTQYESMLTP